MKHFCTLSDYNYLAKGLALYKSLKMHTSDQFRLYYLCLDEGTYNKLKNLSFLEIIPINLKKIEEEDVELQKAKSDRPYNQYCWTLASYFCEYLLKKTGVSDITYIDSDIYFYKDPQIFYQEIEEKSVGIIAHRHNKVGDSIDGAYNVGVIFFKNNAKGREALHWWMDAVLYKKYPHLQTCGDQKYLEDFIPRFGAENICIVDKTFGHAAPWNFRLYKYEKINQGKIIWEDKEQDLLFTHFSRMSYNADRNIIDFTSGCYGDHTLNFTIFNQPEIRQFYTDYFLILKEIHNTWLK